MDDLSFSLNVPSLPLGLRAGFVNLSHAVSQLAFAAHKQWRGYAAGEPVPGHGKIGSRSGSYLRSIKIEQIGELSYRVFSDAPHAKAIEEGSPARDLKKMLLTSHKIRVVRNGPRKGVRYLIIPFRWGTPGTKTFGSQVMSKDVYNIWQSKQLAPSFVTGMGQRLGGYGHVVPTRKYLWGKPGRLTQDHLDTVGEQNGNMRGMVNLRTPGKRGGGAHSHYLTFRIMAEDSKGWIAPAIPAKWPAKTTVEILQPVAREAFEMACAEDVRRILRGGNP